MSKFNAKQVNNNKAVTYEGGDAYNKSLENEWVNFLFSCILQDRFYESSNKQQDRYVELTNAMIDKYGAGFVGKAAVFARNELGMRSISELTAAMLNKYQFEGKRDFYKKYFHRPDGVAEVFGAIDMLGGKRSHALVRGACDYLSGLDEYQVGKYKMSGKTYNMYDLINITHANSSAIDAYKNDTLEIPDTWEAKISGAENQEKKEAEWKRLVEERKLGYMALIRNLRNILSCKFVNSQWAKEHLVPQITNEVAIKKSLIFPYRIYTAWKMIADTLPIEIEMALSDAFIISIGNMPKLEGSSLVVLDVSGSMDDRMSQHSNMRIKEVGAVYGAAIYLSGNDVDFVKFGNHAKWCSYNKYTNVFKLIKAMQENEGCGYGTDIIPVFESIEKHYDRMFLISDMQVMDRRSSWDWYGRSMKSANDAFKEYKLEYGNSHIYSFDLGNYHSQITNTGSNDISYITALNDTVFKILELEENGKSLIDIIKDYNY